MQLDDNEINDAAKRKKAQKLSENKHLHSVRVIRKLIVVEPGENSSKCLSALPKQMKKTQTNCHSAVNKYNNQATTHPNVKHLQWQQGIIWSDKKPDPLPGEHNLCSHALRINVVPNTKHISKFERINYGEVLEVSHDHREVYILGTLDPKSVPLLKHYYKKIQEQIDSKAPAGNPAEAQPATIPQPAAAPMPANILIPAQAIELTNPPLRANPAPAIARIPHRDEPLGLISRPGGSRAADRRIYFYPSRESSRKFLGHVLFDTGATSNLMSERFARMIQAPIGPCRQFTMHGIGKRSVTSYTKCRWQVGNQQNNEIYEDDFYINTGDMYPLDAIVGVQALIKYKLIKWYS